MMSLERDVDLDDHTRSIIVIGLENRLYRIIATRHTDHTRRVIGRQKRSEEGNEIGCVVVSEALTNFTLVKARTRTLE